MRANTCFGEAQGVTAQITWRTNVLGWKFSPNNKDDQQCVNEFHIPVTNDGEIGCRQIPIHYLLPSIQPIFLTAYSERLDLSGNLNVFHLHDTSTSSVLFHPFIVVMKKVFALKRPCFSFAFILVGLLHLYLFACAFYEKMAQKPENVIMMVS